jgi:hypothetical protein
MRTYLFIILLLAGQLLHAEETLCTDKEKIIFSCHVEKKIISLCRPSQAKQSLIYRYGTLGHVELLYPVPGKQSKTDFYRSSNPLYGGEDVNISFKRSTYEYSLYSKIGRADSDEHQESREPIFEDGLTIFRNGKVLKQLVCDDGGEGFREDINWIPSQPVTK